MRHATRLPVLSTLLLLIIVSSSLVSGSRAEPEVSSGTAAVKPRIDWRPTFLSSSVGGMPSAGSWFIVPSDKRSRSYSFGLGKKSFPSEDSADQADQDAMTSDDESRGTWIKRLSDSRGGLRMTSGRGYSFGLGKRGWFPSISYPVSSPYLGDIKRRYSFGLGKRSVDDQLTEAGAAAAAADDLLQ